MQNNVYIYIMIMTVVTYIICALPITFIRKEIRNKRVRSFLYYVTLSVMTFPAILSAASSIYAAGVAFIVAVFLAYKEKSLFTCCLWFMFLSLCAGVYFQNLRWDI